MVGIFFFFVSFTVGFSSLFHCVGALPYKLAKKKVNFYLELGGVQPDGRVIGTIMGNILH